MKIQVKRLKDGKIFTNDMSQDECIYEIHFCTAYTQVIVQEFNDAGERVSSDIICKPYGNESQTSWIDLIAIQDDDLGEFIGG